MGKLLIMILVGLVATSSVSPGQIVYDSGGFESSRFSSTFVNPTEPQILGDLGGQDVGVVQWSYVGPVPAAITTGTAQVIGGIAYQGTQCVFVRTGTANDSWGPTLGYDATGKTVAITWNMAWDSNQNEGQVLNQETDIGIDVMGLASSTRTLIAGAGINTKNTQLFYFEGSDIPQAVTLTPYYVGVGWHQYELDLNYAAQTYQLFVDGNASVSASFVASTSVLSDVDISTWTPQPLPGWGGVYFDNLAVSVVPEPGVPISVLIAFSVLFTLRPSGQGLSPRLQRT